MNCNRSCAPDVGVLLIRRHPAVTFARSQFVPAVPSVLIVLFSQLKIEPLLSVRTMVNVSVPGLLPGAKVPPACTVTAPPMVPEPPSVAPVLTVTALLGNVPLTRSEPGRDGRGSGVSVCAVVIQHAGSSFTDRRTAVDFRDVAEGAGLQINVVDGQGRGADILIGHIQRAAVERQNRIGPARGSAAIDVY